MLHRRDPRGSCMSRKGPWTLACAFAFAILERIGIDDLSAFAVLTQVPVVSHRSVAVAPVNRLWRRQGLSQGDRPGLSVLASM
jgi:hypothetical protein